MRVGVFHPGTQHSWQTARALNHLGLLAWYATTIFYIEGRWPYRIEAYLPGALRERVHAEFSRFFHPDLPHELVRTRGYHEWLERLIARAGMRSTARRLNIAGNAAFGASIGRLLEKEPIDLLWGFDTSSAQAFASAKERGIRCVLDRTLGDPRVYRRIMQSHFERYPEFFLSRDFEVNARHLKELDAEMSLADTILVGSEFCKQTLIDPACRPDTESKIRIVPYCYDDAYFPPPSASETRALSSPIRFIFVGQVHPRKGIHLLLKAFARIPPSAATLTLVGRVAFRRTHLRGFPVASSSMTSCQGMR